MADRIRTMAYGHYKTNQANQANQLSENSGTPEVKQWSEWKYSAGFRQGRGQKYFGRLSARVEKGVVSGCSKSNDYLWDWREVSGPWGVFFKSRQNSHNPTTWLSKIYYSILRLYLENNKILFTLDNA